MTVRAGIDAQEPDGLRLRSCPERVASESSPLRVVCDGVLRTQQRADVIIAKHFGGTFGVSRVLAE